MDIEAELSSMKDDFITMLGFMEDFGKRFTALRAEIIKQEKKQDIKAAVAAKEEGRVRTSAFRRMPRADTEKQVTDMMADKGWISAPELAALNADGNYDHFRYLAGSYATAMRTLERRGILEFKRTSGMVEQFGVGFTQQYRLKNMED